MIPYIGDFAEDATVYHYFNTFDSNDPSASVTITNLADTDIYVYKDGSVTDLVTDGASVVIDFDARTGVHKLTIDTSVSADYAIGSDYMVLIEGTTVDAGTVTAGIFTFSIENRYNAAADDLANATDGLGALKTLIDAIQTDLDNGTDGLGAIKAQTAAIETDTQDLQTQIGTAGAGLTGIAAVGDVTNLSNLPTIPTNWITAAGIAASAMDGKGDWNINKTGYSLTATTGLGDQTANITGTIDTVTDLTNERGKYANGAVWIGPTANTNTTSYVDGIITNPVSTVAAAKTIADALGLRKFYTVRTGASQIAGTITGYEFDGADWSVTTTGGSRDVGTSEFLNAQVIGGTFAATTGTIIWENCRFTVAVSVGPSVMRECLFRNTLTLTDAGNYDFVDCASSIPGAASPTFALGTGAMNIGFRNWSGGITMTGISADDVITLDGSFGGITLSGADGTVDIRGTYKSITDNRTGSPTLTITGAMIPSDLAGVLVDTGTTLPATLTTIDGKVDTVDTVVDGIQTDLDNATDGLGAIKTDTAAVKTVTDQMVFTKANELDVNTQSINGAAVVGDGNATPWDGA